MQIKGFPGAKYASFKTIEEAQDAFSGSYDDQVAKKKKAKAPGGGRHQWAGQVNETAWAVDAACSGDPGIMEYRGVVVSDGSELFRQGPFKVGTNNIGEFLAIVHALALLNKLQDSERMIYTDSRTAMAWVRNKKVKTTLPKNASTYSLYSLIQRAENWLKGNEYSNPIIKWDTESWGEIPADFGRK